VGGALAPRGKGFRPVSFKCGHVALIDPQKVFDNLLVIQLPPLGENSSVPEVLDVVAHSAERNESSKGLDVGGIIILPSLVARKLAGRAAYGTLVTVLGVSLAPQRVPLCLGNLVAQIVRPRRFRD
jgi:hypothetical protein